MNAAWGVAQIARVILPRMAGGGDAIIMSMGYFDDSGTHGSSEVVVWGGLMGTESQWLKFEKDWKAKLAEPLPGKPPLRRFHMADCMARDQEFRGYSDPEKNAVIHDFRQIILDAGVYGYAAAVVIADWNEILGGKSYGRFGDADFFCMNLCVMHAARFARDFTEDRFISLVFDDRKEHTEANRLVLSIFEEAYNTHRGDEDIAGISFLPNTKFVPLQGADMIAWETYNHAKTWRPEAQTSERAHLRRFSETGRFIAHMANRYAIAEIRQMLDELTG
jgi:hypothetical protein